MYTKIEEIFWKDEIMRSFTDDAKLLMLYILTCPHRNIIGFYFLPVQYGSFDLGWPCERFNKGLAELLSNRRVKYNETSNIILVKNYLKYNPLENPNQVKSAIKSLESLPRNTLDADFVDILKGFNKPLYKPLIEHLCKRLGQPITVSETVTVTETLSIKDIQKFYEENGFGLMPGTVLKDVESFINDDDIETDLIIEAMREAVNHNAINWAYVKRILTNCYQKKITKLEQFKAEKKAREMKSTAKEDRLAGIKC